MRRDEIAHIGSNETIPSTAKPSPPFVDQNHDLRRLRRDQLIVNDHPRRSNNVRSRKKLKEKVGQVTNNPDLEAGGKAEHNKGVIEKKAGQIEKAFGK
jgi:hypothetical protein